MRTAVATTFLKPMSSGRNGALLLVCETAGGDTSLVVKLLRIGARELIAEGLAAQLAPRIAVRIPAPFIVEITPEFAHSTGRSDLRSSVGHAFGSELLTGMVSLTPQVPLPHSTWNERVSVLCFDVWVVNVDRKSGSNPNVALHQNQIVAYDHDAAFSWKFCLPPISSESADVFALSSHVFAASFKGQVLDLATFHSNLVAIRADELTEMMTSLPLGWREAVGHAECAAITDTLFARIQGAIRWAEQVQTWLKQ